MKKIRILLSSALMVFLLHMSAAADVVDYGPTDIEYYTQNELLMIGIGVLLVAVVALCLILAFFRKKK